MPKTLNPLSATMPHNLSEQECELLAAFRALSPKKREVLLDWVRRIAVSMGRESALHDLPKM